MFGPSFAAQGLWTWTAYAPQYDVSSSRSFYQWNKPLGASMFYAIVVGGAGKGAAGGSTAATARVGGGGGGSGTIITLQMPAIFLPDVLYVKPGLGSGTLGSASPSVICLDLAGLDFLINAQAGADAATSTAGSGGGIAQNTGDMANLGSMSQIVGATGKAGGANTGGAVGTLGRASATFLQGGGGGGGSTSVNTVIAGGNVTGRPHTTGGPNNCPTTLGGLAGVSGTTAGGKGNNGFGHKANLQTLLLSGRTGGLWFNGGAGGGAGGASNGGDGGEGGLGCGGGGGGAGAVGGNGGNGGDGFVIIGTM